MKRRILLVDDEIAILLTLKAILEMHGFLVETASSKSEALTKLRKDEFDLVITDMVLETETSGFDVIKAAKERPFKPATAILTAYPSVKHLTAGSDALALIKPVGTQDLLRQIEVLLNARNSGNPELPQEIQQRLVATAADQSVAFDAFVCHASEDKASFVRPLARALRNIGLRIWFDEFEMKVGDSLRRSIDHGLKSSEFGIVVLSRAFFAKHWPQYELDSMAALESKGRQLILPIWYGVTADDVASYSPALADRIALIATQDTVRKIARKLRDRIAFEVV